MARLLALGAGFVAGSLAAELYRRHQLITTAAPELRVRKHYYSTPPANALHRRWRLARAAWQQPASPPAGVSLDRLDLPDGPTIYLYETPQRQRPGPAVLWLHGGGRILGRAIDDHAFCGEIASNTGALVVSVDYRLAPEHPFPAGLDDCMQALRYLHANHEALGIDPARLAVSGASAGGGLAAELAQRAYDEHVPVAKQVLVYPMLDDRTVGRDLPRTLGWNAAANRYAWRCYLGHGPETPEPRPYAAAARRADLRGLPPAWIGIGTLDLFYPETLDYAQRLRAAGVACTLNVVEGMYHAADLAVEPRPPSVSIFHSELFNALT